MSGQSFNVREGTSHSLSPSRMRTIPGSTGSMTPNRVTLRGLSRGLLWTPKPPYLRLCGIVIWPVLASAVFLSVVFAGFFAGLLFAAMLFSFWFNHAADPSREHGAQVLLSGFVTLVQRMLESRPEVQVRVDVT